MIILTTKILLNSIIIIIIIMLLLLLLLFKRSYVMFCRENEFETSELKAAQITAA